MRLHFVLCSLFVFIFVLFFCHSYTQANDYGQVAIIIDDFGGDVKGVESFLSGSIPITVAIMPFMEHSTEQAERAYQAGLEVMIHMPMEPKKGKTSWLGPNAITSDLSNEEVRLRVMEAIEKVPHAKGINNHMGSKIVENERIIRVILEVAKEHNLYVVDSGTSSASVISKLAKELDIPYAKRSVFLDDTFSTQQHVAKQMTSLLKIAKKNKKAVGIGHVGVKGNETYIGVEHALSIFSKEHVNIVPMSHLLDTEIDHDHSGFWQARKETPI
ncbi:divergent polysaccharide deacetylase family protein [Alkalihalobacillus deserti]|uniref:divergent polysaccharide deacetylase family protein n=1 Tax=Alkalihalobacillus deserti TaxID=2879466 RepID=UPI001D144827|nr:divergent polysaccharide deacetylase family protein [Alkalihalobacillus deserti]